MSKYTWYDLWLDVEHYSDWLSSKPKWWRFLKRRAWKRAKPKERGADHA